MPHFNNNDSLNDYLDLESIVNRPIEIGKKVYIKSNYQDIYDNMYNDLNMRGFYINNVDLNYIKSHLGVPIKVLGKFKGPEPNHPWWSLLNIDSTEQHEDTWVLDKALYENPNASDMYKPRQIVRENLNYNRDELKQIFKQNNFFIVTPNKEITILVDEFLRNNFGFRWPVTNQDVIQNIVYDPEISSDDDRGIMFCIEEGGIIRWTTAAISQREVYMDDGPIIEIDNIRDFLELKNVFIKPTYKSKKIIREFKDFINENIHKYLQPKSDDEILKYIDEININEDKIMTIIRLQKGFDLLPRNSVGKCIYFGSLNLGWPPRIAKTIHKLPDNLTVLGELNLYNQDLTELPDKLAVQNDLIISGNKKIERLPENLMVGGNVLFFNHPHKKLIVPKKNMVGKVFTKKWKYDLYTSL